MQLSSAKLLMQAAAGGCWVASNQNQFTTPPQNHIAALSKQARAIHEAEELRILIVLEGYSVLELLQSVEYAGPCLLI
jgi:hypothetical protein